ncbi:hypothetical protein V1505DRAFT_357960 [Lipomyces doorenjongii]
MEEVDGQDNLAQRDAAIEGEAHPTANEKKRGVRRNLNKVWDAGDTKGLSKCAFCNQFFTTGNGHGCVAKSWRKEREADVEHEDVDTVTHKMRPLSPDTHVEVAASREEYDQVLEILEDELGKYFFKYPQLLYDSGTTLATVAAAPSPLHSRMAYELVTTSGTK